MISGTLSFLQHISSCDESLTVWQLISKQNVTILNLWDLWVLLGFLPPSQFSSPCPLRGQISHHFSCIMPFIIIIIIITLIVLNGILYPHTVCILFISTNLVCLFLFFFLSFPPWFYKFDLVFTAHGNRTRFRGTVEEHCVMNMFLCLRRRKYYF